jgi:hypothetical protein
MDISQLEKNITKAVTTRKTPARKKTSSVVEAAAGTIKMPISFKEFAKKPTAAIAFLAVTGIAYVYVDLKNIFENNSIQQNVRIDKLEYRDSLKTVVIRRLDSSNASSSARFEMLESLNKIKNP